MWASGELGVLRAAALLLLSLLVGCSRAGFTATFNEVRGDPYPLDDVSRDATDDAGCPAVELTMHPGSALAFVPPLQVVPAFSEPLLRFEQITAQLARELFGRAPSKIRHAGAYLCRPVRQRSERWSEHALGNAVDVVGFDFPRLPRGDGGVTVALPKRLLAPFQVRVAQHWQAGAREDERLRQDFLRRLAAALEEEDIFRGMIGPADPRHRTHLHLDMGPFRYRRL